MNFFDLLPWWTWLLGTLGIGGVIALAFFAPLLAADLWRRLSDAIGAAIRTPLGAAIVFGAVGLGVGWFISGTYARHQCNDAIEQLRQESKEKVRARDAEIKQEIGKKYDAIVGGLEEQAAERERKVQAYEDAIKTDGNRAKCVLGPNTLKLRP